MPCCMGVHTSYLFVCCETDSQLRHESALRSAGENGMHLFACVYVCMCLCKIIKLVPHVCKMGVKVLYIQQLSSACTCMYVWYVCRQMRCLSTCL